MNKKRIFELRISNFKSEISNFQEPLCLGEICGLQRLPDHSRPLTRTILKSKVLKYVGINIRKYF